jgi:hypothetical protein
VRFVRPALTWAALRLDWPSPGHRAATPFGGLPCGCRAHGDRALRLAHAGGSGPRPLVGGAAACRRAAQGIERARGSADRPFSIFLRREATPGRGKGRVRRRPDRRPDGARRASAGQLSGAPDRVHHVPAPFPSRLPPAERPLPGSPAVVLFGSEAWRPNREGTRWFVDQVWPRVRAALPRAELHVLGLSVRAGAGVCARPAPADSREAFAAGAVLVVPLRVAAGVRMKILVAWRGRAVATPNRAGPRRRRRELPWPGARGSHSRAASTNPASPPPHRRGPGPRPSRREPSRRASSVYTSISGPDVLNRGGGVDGAGWAWNPSGSGPRDAAGAVPLAYLSATWCVGLAAAPQLGGRSTAALYRQLVEPGHLCALDPNSCQHQLRPATRSSSWGAIARGT